MYSSVSNEFKTECKRDVNAYKRIAKIHVVEDNIDITNDDDLVDFTIEEIAYSGNTFVGNSVAKKISLNIVNDGSYNLENKEIEVYVGIDYVGDGSDIELIPYGNFIISKPLNEEVKNTSNYIGYDYMIKAQTPYVETNIVYPMSLYNYLNAICVTLGITLGNLSIPNGNYQVLGDAYTNGETFRQVIEEIARCCGGYAVIGRDNKLYIRTLTLINNNEDEVITPGEYFEDFGTSDVYGPVNRVAIALNYNVVGEDTIREDTQSIAQNGLTEIRVSDISFLNSEAQRELVIDGFWTSLHNISYKPYSTNYYGYPYVDVGDIIKITKPDNTNIYSYIFNHKFTYNGAFSGNVEAPTLSDVEDEYKATTDARSAIRNTELKVDKINGEISSIVEEIGDRSQKTTSITQDIDQINLTIGDLENLTLDAEGINPITLENCLEGELIRLSIKGNNSVYGGLLPSDTLTPSNTLTPYGDSILKVYSDNKCPTNDDAWIKERRNLAQDLILEDSINRWCGTNSYVEGGARKYRSGMFYQEDAKFYYMECQPNSKYKVIIPDSISEFRFAMGAYEQDIFELMEGSQDTYYSEILATNGTFDTIWHYDYDKKEYEIKTNDNSKYIMIRYWDTLENNFDLYCEDNDYYMMTSKDLIPIDKSQTTYFYFKGYGDYYLTDVWYYNSSEQYIGNYETEYSEAISTQEWEVEYPNNAVYMKFIVQKLDENVVVLDSDNFELSKVKPMLANSLDYDFVKYNTYEIDLGINEVLRQYSSTIFDEFVYDSEYLYNSDEEDNEQQYKSYVIRRVGVNSGGTLYPLVEPIIEPRDVFIKLVDGRNYIDLGKPYEANMKATYVQITEFTKVFATQYEVTSQILQLANSITLLVTEKVGEDEIIAKINLAVEDEQGIIEITGNQIIIKSDYFELTADGQITARKGYIGGLTLTRESLGSYLSKDFLINGESYQSGLYIPEGETNINVPFLYAGTPSSGHLEDAKLRITHKGDILMNGESCSTIIRFDSGRTAMQLTSTQLDFRIDNNDNSLFARFERQTSGFGLFLQNAPRYWITDNLHGRTLYMADTANGGQPQHYWVGDMWVDRNVTGTYEQVSSGGGTSDERLKDNIKDSTTDALEIIDKLQFKQFDWNETTAKAGTHIDIGLIAQDVEKINENYIENLSRIYQGKKEDLLGIDILNLLTTTTKAVQELNQKVKELEEELRELKGEN